MSNHRRFPYHRVHKLALQPPPSLNHGLSLAFLLRDVEEILAQRRIQPATGSPDPLDIIILDILLPAPLSQNTVGDCAKKDDPCFPSSAKVVRTAGLFPEIVRIDELKEGDEILAATAEGTISKDMVSLLSIAKPEASASTYVVLKTAANYTVTLTEGHHIPVGESCCSKVKVAKEIAVGDVVHVARAHGLAATTVTSKTIGHSSGLHSPVLVSCSQS